jgi:hypothetical protein
MKSVFRMLDEAIQQAARFQLQFGRVDHRFGIPHLALLLIFLFARATAAQGNYPSYLTNTGLPVSSAPEPVELGYVDASSGSLNLSIPLGSYAQRATSQPKTITLEYNSNIWAVQTIGTTPTWEPSNATAAFSNGGWFFSFQLEYTYAAGLQILTQGCAQDIPWIDPNGTTHYFHLATADNSSCPSEASAYATDSSGYEVFAWNNGFFTVYAPDGTFLYSNLDHLNSNGNQVITAEDSNGNYLSEPTYSIYGNPRAPFYVTDTLGRQIATYGIDNSTIILSTSQGTVQYQIAYTTINVQSNFQQSGVSDTSTSIEVVRSLTLPDAAQSTYYFTYDCDESSGNPACVTPAGQSAYYGVLKGITLPTGGQDSYSYQTFQDRFGNKGLWVESYAGSGGNWSYSPHIVGSGFCGPNPQVFCQNTTVTSPTGITEYAFYLNNGAFPYTITYKDLSSNVLSTVTNTWDWSQQCQLIDCIGSSYIRLLNQTTTVPVPDGNMTKQVSYTYDSSNNNIGIETGNQTEIQEWRYLSSGSSFPSVADRTTYKSYLYYTGVNNTNYTGTNNINRPLSVTLCNNSGSDSACPGGGSRVSQVLYTYDAYGSSGLTSITGVTNHDDADVPPENSTS